MQENLPVFAPHLCVPDVHLAFVAILTHVRKNAKPDFLPQLEEFEAKIGEVSTVKVVMYLRASLSLVDFAVYL